MAGKVDLAGDSTADPFRWAFENHTHELVAENASEIHIALKDLQVG
jgi:hypothetical protein